jgi:enoyl-CoA hydratase/carnithine racemase
MSQNQPVRDVPLIREDDGGGVVTLRMNRPLQMNALSEAAIDALQFEFDALASDSEVRCVVIAGAGKAFCAGHDLLEMHRNRQLAYYQALFARCSQLMQRIQSLPVPVIARVHGLATAAGCQLVASCDLAIASETARFAVSGINVGLFCSTPAVALSRNISSKRAFDMLVTGRFIDAATAMDWGLLSETVSASELDAAIARKTGEIASKSPAAIRYGKSMFYRQRQMALGDAYAYASEVMARNMMHHDACEGIDAFLNKRKPVWGLKCGDDGMALSGSDAD